MGKGKGILYRLPLWLMFVAGIFGGLVLYGPGADIYDHHYSYLRAGQRNLDDMAQLLHSYKAAHGRYPTTEEGLAVLDGYASRFGLSRVPTSHWRGPWKLLGKPWPGNEEKLRSLLGCPLVTAESFENYQNPTLPGLEAGICDSGYVYILYHGQPLGLTNTPFCYENRKADAKSSFPADWFGMFSRDVDQGVRIACPGSRGIWESTWAFRKTEIVFWSLIVILGLWWGYGWFRHPYACPRARTVAWLALVLFLSIGVVWFIEATSCATTVIPVGKWTRGAGISYLAIQSDMLSAGLISKDTYDRRITAASLVTDLQAARKRLEAQGEQKPPPATAPNAPAPTSRPSDANETGRP